jgi:hypothetical protein
MYLICRCFERTAPIWFEKIVDNTSNFLEQKEVMFILASTSCIPDIIKIGYWNEPSECEPTCAILQ